MDMNPKIWIRAFGTLDTRQSPHILIGEWQGDRDETRAAAKARVEEWLTEHYGDNWEDTNRGKGVLPRYQNKDGRLGSYIPVLFQVDDPHGQHVYRREDFMDKQALVAIHDALVAGNVELAINLSKTLEAAAEAGKLVIQQKLEAAYARWEETDLNRIESDRWH